MQFDAKGGVIRTWLADAIVSGHADPVASAAAAFHLDLDVMQSYMDRLVETGWFTVSGDAVYALGENREIVRHYRARKLDVDYVWSTFFRPFFALPSSLLAIARLGLVDTFKNALEHADASNVTVLMRSVDGMLSVCVQDDGKGIFRSIADRLALPDLRMSMLELAKGGISANDVLPAESLSMVSRLFDFVVIEANGLQWVQRAESGFTEFGGPAIHAADHEKKGTSVAMVISLESRRTVGEVLNRYASRAGQPGRKAVVPVRLASLEGETLESRKQAASLMSRLEGFDHVVLDFDEVSAVGPDFTDGVFHDFARAHPGIWLEVVNAALPVKEAIARARKR